MEQRFAVPDPSILTTEALQREVCAIKELMSLRIEALNEKMEMQFLAAEKAFQAELSSQEKAVLKAENLATARYEAQNEWRDTMTDLIASTLQRPEYQAGHEALSDKVDALGARLDRAEGLGVGKQQSVGLLLGAIAATGTLVGIIVVVIDLFMK